MAPSSDSEMSAPVGIARRVDDDPAGSRRDRVQNRPRPDGEAVLRIGPREHRRRLGQLDLLGERRPVRGVRDDFVARAEQRERRVVERLLAARGDDDLGLLVLDAVVGAVPVADRALQVGDAGDRRVAREIAVDRGAGPASLIASGVGKSGSPAPKSMTSIPDRRRRSTVAVTFMVGDPQYGWSDPQASCLPRQSFPAQAFFDELRHQAVHASAEREDFFDQA